MQGEKSYVCRAVQMAGQGWGWTGDLLHRNFHFYGSFTLEEGGTEGGRKDGWFWQKTRTKEAECLTPTYSAPQVLILDRGRLWSPDPGPQPCPEPAGASRALESLYRAAGNDRKNLAQIKLCNSTMNNPELRQTLCKCPRQQAFIHLLLPIPSPQQAIPASHKLFTTEQPKCRTPGCKL